MCSSSPVSTPKLQLAAEQPSTGECCIPPNKDTPHPGANERPQQESRRGEITLRIKLLTCQRCSGSSNKILCAPGPRDPSETPAPFFGLGVQNEAGQRLTEFYQESALVIANTLYQQHSEDSTHGHHQMVNTEIRLIIFFTAKDGEALYSQQKQDQELTVAQIMNSLLPNSDLN